MPEKQPNIYDLGFDKGLNRVLPDSSTGVVYDHMNSVNTGEVINYGALSLKSLTIAGSTRYVGPSDDLQAAIDAANREGGGEIVLFSGTYNLTKDIELRDRVRLRGAGLTATVLNFSGAFGLKAYGTGSGAPQDIQTFFIEDLKVQGSTGIGIDIDFGLLFSLKRVQVSDVGGAGIRIQHSELFTVDGAFLSSNGSHGIELVGDSTFRCDLYNIQNCYAQSNGGSGFYWNHASGANSHFSAGFFNCTANGNTGNGFTLTSGNTLSIPIAVVSCESANNTGAGFSVDQNGVSLIACTAGGNTAQGFLIDATGGCRVIGCTSRVDTGVNFDFSGAVDATFIGNYLSGVSSTVAPSSEIDVVDVNMISEGNQGSSAATERKVFRMKNSSGASISNGMVVVLGVGTSGEEVTTTTTNGDNKVFGIAHQTIANNAYGDILVHGYTTRLLATNGTTSIAVGDWLSAYSHAYYAKVATSGDMAFALALEAPTTSTAQINALLLSPRLI